MFRRVPLVGYLAIGFSFCAMLIPSNPSNPLLFYEKVHDRISYEIQMRKPFETLPWSYQTHLATDTWDVRSGDTSTKVMSTKTEEWLRDIISSPKNETAACVGEITGVDLEQPDRYVASQTLARCRILLPLNANCPDGLSIYSPWIAAMSAHGPVMSRVTDTPGESHLVSGDRILVILQKEPSIESKYSPVWKVLKLWYLKESASDSKQYIYNIVSAGLDTNAMAEVPRGYRGHLSAFYKRIFETGGTTLGEGIRTIQALYMSHPVTSVRK